MANDDDAREALRAQAEQLRREREARSQDEAAAQRASKANEAARAKSFSERRLWSSVSRFTWPLIFGCFAAAALFWGMSADFAEAHNPNPWPGRLAWVALAMPIVVALRHVAIGPWRYRRWVNGLPFRLEGLTEALGSDRAVTKVTVSLGFADSAAPTTVVEELVRARLPVTREDTPAQLHGGADGLAVSAEFYTETANWPLHRWARALVNDVLLEVHRGWPLASVSVTVTAHDDFHVPSGSD